MSMWIVVWLFFWVGALGAVNYLFKKYKITYYEYSWQHTLFYTVLSIILFVVYRDQFSIYFNNFSFYHALTIASLFVLWLFAPALYKNDYYTKRERLGYQVPKFFEVAFQDLCFLGGLLTFGLSPMIFGLVFFVVHIPAVLFLPKKFALLPIGGSLVGGLLFAHLQSYGTWGFLAALFIHLSFWAALHFALSRKILFGITPVKR